MSVDPHPSRPARAAEVDRVVEILVLAFQTDPIWSVALATGDGRTDHLAPYWRLFVDGAMRFGTVHVTDDLGACAVWLPPGEDELDDARATQLDALLDDVMTPSGPEAIHRLYERFEASRGSQPDHAYLSLLATDPDRRGQGIGQRLLAADLERWDAQGIPAYLESTNPANDHRYERAGFRPIGSFEAVLDDARVTAFWRHVGGDGAG
jgi:ribosomal protein S18 acetylase RimI-like enzyme